MSMLKRKLLEMKDNAFCFVHLIADYVNRAIKDERVRIPLGHHLKTCAKCNREKEEYEQFLKTAAVPPPAEDDFDGLPGTAAFKQAFTQAAPAPAAKPGIQPGQIWSTPGFPDYLRYQYGIKDKALPYCLEPRLFYIHRFDEETGTAEGYPVNCDYLEFAAEFDLIVAADETNLGFAFMIETWNPVSTGAEFLQEYWGIIPDAMMKKVDALTAEHNNRKVQEPVPQEIVTGRPIRFDQDLRRQFQQLEQQITQYISAPLTEKKEFSEFQKQFASQKILETMLVYSVVYIHRHKDFLRVAGDNNIYIYSKEQTIFDGNYTLSISINEMETEYLLQIRITDNETGAETRSFVADLVQWEGELPDSPEKLKIAYLFFQQNNIRITHCRLWEKGKRLTVPKGKNMILGLYKADNKETMEFIPIEL